ncbi:MAG TPA: hypothetical protein VIK38_03730, partial [Coriobacteriia bacterium]
NVSAISLVARDPCVTKVAAPWTQPGWQDVVAVGVGGTEGPGVMVGEGVAAGVVVAVDPAVGVGAAGSVAEGVTVGNGAAHAAASMTSSRPSPDSVRFFTSPEPSRR